MSSADVKQYSIDISGMTCDHCAGVVTNVIRGLTGVREVAVDLAANKAAIVFDEREHVLSRMIEAVRKAGYDVRGFRETPLPQPTLQTEPWCKNTSLFESTE